jgi:DNA repair protein RecN (Recombination protein N)
MLAKLYIQNYALIDKLWISFDNGLNILTGETGAGKSILVGAIGMILGRRAESGVMLNPDEKCVVEAEFRLKDDTLQDVLKENDIDAPDAHLIIRREVSPGGKSRAFVNDSPVNLNALRAVAERLVDLHGQHEGQLLLEPAYQLQVLDQYAGLAAQAAQFKQLLAQTQAVAAEIDGLRRQEAEARRQTDYYRFQVQELTEAKLQPAEDEDVENRLRVLQHAEQITENLARNYARLEEGDSALNLQLKQMQRELEKLSALDARVAPLAQKIGEAKFLLADVAAELQALAETTELDPNTLQALADRQTVYNKLKMKFAVHTAAELIALRDEFAAKLNQFENLDDRIAALEKQKAALLSQLADLGLALEKQRLAVATQLGKKITGLLHEVGLTQADFAIEVTRLHAANGLLAIDGQAIQPNAAGINGVQFNIRTNAGLPLGPLAAIASGGEVSRVMLAVKAVLARKLALGTLIFDEIDTGISGEVALKVGRVMEQLGAQHQVLAITHLPQIASRSGSHYFIYKTTEAGRAYSRMRKLEKADRVEEIAKMISGESPSPLARKTATELLQMAV